MEARDLLWLIPALPLLGAALNAVLGPRAPRSATTAVAVGAPLLSLLVALVCLYQYVTGIHPGSVEQVLYAWSVGPLTVDVAFLLDALSAVMTFIVTFIGFLIHVYSAGYMSHEKGYQRYFVYLNLFMAAMLLLVLGNNFLVMFVGWEGVGLCSYLLIGYYYEERVPPEAGKKAFIVNRIGDFAFLAGVLALFGKFGTLTFEPLFEQIRANPDALTEPYRMGLTFAGFVALCLFVGAMGKSAQIPLYVWLPDAMAGPTPVSALIHAATMVTAGVYMVARTNVIYQLAPDISLFVASIGAATAIFAASIGLAQNDIKKVLAYSTVSQLGYMFLAAGLGAYSVAIFHVGTHAFFKALLFLGSGSVIHAMSGEQDMRRMGGLRHKLPVTFWTFLIATLAIAGFPLVTAGFYSKDAILATAFQHQKVLWVIALITAGLTACYMFRAVFMTFFGKFRGTHEQEHHLHESPPVMTVPLIVLAVGSIAAGWVGMPPILWPVNHIERFLAPVTEAVHGAAHEAHHLSHATEWLLTAAAVGIAALGIFLAWRIWGGTRGLAGEQGFASRFPTLHRLLENKWYVDEIYDRVIVRPLAWLSRMSFKVLDTLLIEGSLHVGAFLTELTGDLGRFTTTGNVRNYALYFFLGLVALFWWVLL